MHLSRAFRIRSKDVIAFVGAGGKTTAMFRLADELVAQDMRVITTTTTRLGAAQIERAPTALRYDPSSNFVARARVALAAQPHILIVGDDVEDGKVSGVLPGFIDQLAALDAVDAVIYEADGARRLPFKAPAAHEPVLANSTTLLVPVIGISAIGAPLDDAHAHRAAIAARLAGARVGETLTPMRAARVLAHSQGGLKGKPRAARAIILINQVESDATRDSARALARLLLGYSEIAAVAIGAARDDDPIRETQRRVAAIVLAAGAGARMPGRVKQLLPWRGKTLIENALSIVAPAQATEKIVVLGAQAAQVRAAIRDAPARVVINRSWEGGHSTSIRAGLNALSPQIDAAIFVNADQPLLTTDAINAIIRRYYETDAPIVVPLYAGTRGSPVLFARAHFEELKNLQGEQGGRELLSKYRDQIAAVEFADARMAMDVDTPEDYASIAGEN
jgi:molybdenum cofactor cytidylyltransferase